MRDSIRWFGLVALLACASPVVEADSITPLPPIISGYGVGTSTWRFSTDFSRDDFHRIEFCYQEKGSEPKVVATLDIRPFQSSDSATPELKILYSQVFVGGKKRVFLLAGYGIYFTSEVLDLPGLTSHGTFGSGTPHANQSGEITLTGYSNTGVSIDRNGIMRGAEGRLFFRCVTP